MKSIIRMIAPLIFLAFTACGGGDEGGPPPAPLNSPLSKEGVQTQDDMLNQIAQLKSGACDQQGTEVMLILIASRANQQPGGPGFGQPPPQLPPPNPGCENLLNNIIWNFTHILKQNGEPWANDMAAKLWLAKQIAGFLNHIRDKVAPVAAAAGINPDQLLTVFADQLKPYFQSMLARVGTGTPLAANAASYMNGMGGPPPPMQAGGSSFGYNY